MAANLIGPSAGRQARGLFKDLNIALNEDNRSEGQAADGGNKLAHKDFALFA